MEGSLQEVGGWAVQPGGHPWGRDAELRECPLLLLAMLMRSGVPLGVAGVQGAVRSPGSSSYSCAQLTLLSARQG